MPRTNQEFIRIFEQFPLVREKSPHAYTQLVRFFATNGKLEFESLRIIEDESLLVVKHSERTNFGQTLGRTFYGAPGFPAHVDDNHSWNSHAEIKPLDPIQHPDDNSYFGDIPDEVILDASVSLLKIILSGGFSRPNQSSLTSENATCEVNFDPFTLGKAVDVEQLSNSIRLLSHKESMNVVNSMSNHFDLNNMFTPDMMHLLTHDVNIGNKASALFMRICLFFLKALLLFSKTIQSQDLSSSEMIERLDPYPELLTHIKSLALKVNSEHPFESSDIESKSLEISDIYFIDDYFGLRLQTLGARLFSENEDNLVSRNVLQRNIWISIKFYLSLISLETRPKTL